MPESDRDLDARLAVIEQARASGVAGWAKDAAALLSPLVFAVLGVYFNSVLHRDRVLRADGGTSHPVAPGDPQDRPPGVRR